MLNPHLPSKSTPVGKCIYCGFVGELTDEHVVPFGLSGKLILPEASCNQCQNVTAALEGKLLRGYWWPMRRNFGMTSRRKSEQPELFSGQIKFQNGLWAPVKIRPADFPEIWLNFFKRGELTTQIGKSPYSKEMVMRSRSLPKFVYLDGKMYFVKVGEDIKFDVNLDTFDLMRFIAKVAHAAAIFELGYENFATLNLSRIILGNSDNAMKYIGSNSSGLLSTKLPGNTINRIYVRRDDLSVVVALQFFVHLIGDPPPIYEAYVGNLLS